MALDRACAQLRRIVDVWILSERAPSLTGANGLNVGPKPANHT
jgi:hypothetical protein